MWKNLENCITKQTHQRDTSERRRETRESAPFPDRRRDQQGVKRVTSDCALSRKLSLKRSHSVGATKTEFIHSGSPFHHHQNARKFTKCTSVVCLRERKDARYHQKRERGKRSVTKVNHVLRSGAYTAFFFTEFVFFSVVSAFEGGGGGLSRGRKRRFRAQS